jgi:hypothetical protein
MKISASEFKIGGIQAANGRTALNGEKRNNWAKKSFNFPPVRQQAQLISQNYEFNEAFGGPPRAPGNFPKRKASSKLKTD